VTDDRISSDANQSAYKNQADYRQARSEGLAEGIRLAFETHKHLTTLNAGSIVLIATFLSDIFPKTQGGALDALLYLKLLMCGSFLLFGLSLALSSYVLIRYPHLLVTTLQRRVASYSEEDTLYNALLRGASVVCYFLGLLCFGIAVSINLF